VFFTSDNGAWYIPPPTEAGTVGPFQGTYAAHNLGYTDTGKGSTWEGGFRVPAIAWWPGKIVSGSVAENFTSSVDLLPTLLYYSGGAVPKDLIIDGQSISAVLEQTGNHSSTYSELKPFFYYRGPKLMATKMGAFKAHFITHSGFGHESFSYHDPPLLFNIEIDPQEREALSVKNYQDIVNDIIEAARSHNETVVPGTPQLDLIDYRAMDCNGLSQKQSGCCLEFGGKCST
jgi:arylsulfatase A-like enzyme